MSSIRIRQRATGLSVVAFLLASSASLLAQSGAGTIQGTVQDATSAAIPGATIQALNIGTGVTVDTTSNDGGFFAIKGLGASTYRVTVAASGMKKSESTITLQNGQVLVFNPQLTVGEVSEKVTVSGETIQLATYDSGRRRPHPTTPSEWTKRARFGTEHGPWSGRGRPPRQRPDGRSDGVLARWRPHDQS
jgi:hypothetical protein